MSHSYSSYLLVLCLLQLSNATCPSEPRSPPDLIYLGFPAECAAGTDGSKCHTYLRMAPNRENDSFIDFYLEGDLKGWVAVGFSEDKLMVNTDVVGCKQDKNGSLGIINSWNPNVTNISKRHNEIDPSQDLMCNYSIKYEDKRIKCHFSRYFGIINEGYDFDLNESYYLILGRSDNQSPVDEAFPIHTVTPNVSDLEYDAYSYMNNRTTTYPNWSVILRKTHGVLMLVALAFMASTGAFFSSWLRPALPKGRWLLFHRGLVITTVVLVLIGFTSIFVANKDHAGLIRFSCSQKTAHFAIGIFVTGLILVNPILEMFRCKQNSSKRWIFNMIHAPVGAVAIILGHVNLGLGIEQYERGCSSSKELLIFLIYLVWQLGFVTVMQVVLNIVFSVIAFKSHGKERYMLAPSLVKLFMKMPTSDENTPINNAEEKRDRPSKDYKVRMALFAVNTTVNLIMVIVIAVMIGRTQPF